LDKKGVCAKEGFRMYDDGQFKNQTPRSRHPNILKTVIEGKKGWGLWLNEWTSGISDGDFIKEEILKEFSKRSIEIPDSFIKDFENRLLSKKIKRWEKELEILRSNSVNKK
jgi:hypothetical protein